MASRSAIKAGTLGPFSPLVEALPATKPYLDAAATWCMSPPDQVPEVPRQIGVAATPE